MNKKQTKTDFIVETDPKHEKKFDTVSIEKPIEESSIKAKKQRVQKVK